LGYFDIQRTLLKSIQVVMNSKLFFTLSVFVIILCSYTPKSNCADAYTSASYGLSHSKKAFKAHNFDHQKYYAGRALEALENTRDLVGECGCDGAMNSLADGIENLEEAMDPVDWKMGRYYTQRAMDNTYAVLENLDICSMDGEATAQNEGNTENESQTNNSEENEQALVEFEQAVQENLKQLNEKIKEQCSLMGCESSEFVLDEASFINIKKETFKSIEDAQKFYREQAIKAYQQVMTALHKCGEMQ